MARVVVRYLSTGTLARAAGVGRETVRFYEDQGLIAAAARTAAGYRQFTPETVDAIRFVKQTQLAGFSIREIQYLLKLRAADRDTCGTLNRLLEDKLKELDSELVAMQGRRAALDELARQCSRQDASRTCGFVRNGPGCC